MPKFSVIIPVYNRPNEVRDLLESLKAQTSHNFEVIIVEDGSTTSCKDQCDMAKNQGLDVKYIFKDNEGRSIARNRGMEEAKGEYFVFFDSDCIIPPAYFADLENNLSQKPVDCFGGPDAAHHSFSSTQKAINYTMTSFLTTGGIRGGKLSLEKFTPRTFNMGFSRKVYETVGGFREMFSEDIDMSTRIKQAGFSITLFPGLAVWHKRRIDFRKFLRQVWVFGMSRITLKLLYPQSLKLVHTLPAVALILGIACIFLAVFVSPWWILPLPLYILAVMTLAWVSTKSLTIALKAIPAAIIQIGGYGSGFLYAWTNKILLGKGRNIEQEISLRQGK